MGSDSRADQGSADRCQGESSSELQSVHSFPPIANTLSRHPGELLDYFRSLADSVRDGLFVLEEQGRFEYANPTGLDVLKWPQHEVLDRKSNV